MLCKALIQQCTLYSNEYANEVTIGGLEATIRRGRSPERGKEFTLKRILVTSTLKRYGDFVITLQSRNQCCHAETSQRRGRVRAPSWYLTIRPPSFLPPSKLMTLYDAISFELLKHFVYIFLFINQESQVDLLSFSPLPNDLEAGSSPTHNPTDPTQDVKTQVNGHNVRRIRRPRSYRHRKESRGRSQHSPSKRQRNNEFQDQ